jgi:hypothetical protein
VGLREGQQRHPFVERSGAKDIANGLTQSLRGTKQSLGHAQNKKLRTPERSEQTGVLFALQKTKLR